jgi:pimeloyl-ACP methyl ester carboxylesterase
MKQAAGQLPTTRSMQVAPKSRIDVIPGRGSPYNTSATPVALPLPRWLPTSVWPFETTALDVDGSSIAIADAGKGPTLLFYTGIGAFVWRDVMRRLSGDFRCIAVDPPGIGMSAPVPRASLTLENSARALSAVIQALDLKDLTLVVHDTGAPPAIAAAGRTPERVRGLVGVNSFGWKPSGRPFRGMLAVMGSGVVRRLDLATGAIARITSTSFGVGRHLDDASRRAYRAGLLQELGAFHDYLREARFSDDLYAEVTRALTGPFRPLPLLTIFGEKNDPLGFQPQWKRLFPTARQVTVPKGNHFPMCDDPDLVAQSIREWHRDLVATTLT